MANFYFKTVIHFFAFVFLCCDFPAAVASDSQLRGPIFIAAPSTDSQPLSGTMSITKWADKHRQIQQFNIDQLKCYRQHGRIVTVEVEHSPTEFNLKLTENDDVLLTFDGKPLMTGDSFVNNSGRVHFLKSGIEIGEVQVLDTQLQQRVTISGFLNCTESIELIK